MKLKTVSIKDFRGIRHLDLAPDGENLVIWGYNGAGKSAVIDAIEFLLTGDVQRLHGSGTQGITLRSHAPHVEAEPEDAVVTAEVELNSGLAIEISRSVGEPSLPTYPDEAETDLLPLFQAAENRHFMLTRRDILRFVQETDAGRAQQMKSLLALGDIEQVRQVLVSTANQARQDSITAEAEVTTARQRICQLLNLAVFADDEILMVINSFREVLNAGTISELDASEVRQDVDSPGSGEEATSANREELLASAANSLLEDTDFEEELETSAEELQQHIETLRGDPELQKLADKKRLFELGVDLVGEVDECPLCGTVWEPELLEAHVQDCLGEARTGSEVLEKLQNAADLLSEPATAALSAIQNFEDNTEGLNSGIDFGELKSALTETTEFLHGPATGYQSYDRDIQDIPHLVALRSMRQQVQNLATSDSEQEEGEPDVETDNLTVTPERAWEALTRAEDRIASLEQAKQKKERNHTLERRAARLKEAFLAARDKQVEQIYNDVSAHFSSLYATIHSPDEEGFEAILRPIDAGVDMQVPFYGRGSYAPNALHSEGHQDSMGLCLFLSLRESLPGDSLPLVLLDDVVMSIDSGHRKEVARLLKEEFGDEQFIITTHDKNWARQLRAEGVVSKNGRVDLYNWNVETGPSVSTVGDFLEKVRNEMGRDVNAASARLRRGAEAYFADACHNLRGTVIYDNHRRWTLGDFLPSAVSQMGDLLSAGKQLANERGADDLRRRLQELDDKRGQAANDLQLEQWPVSPATHFTRWEDLSPNEFEYVVNAFEELFEVFTCQRCESQLSILMDEYDVGGVACASRCTSWFI